jgi:hypothetical protein
MSFLLTALSAALLLALGIGSARADSFVDTLASNTTIPLPSQSCFYVDQFNGTSYSNTKLCSGWAKAIGALNATNNLSDLTSLSTARANLSLGSAAISSTGTSGATIPLLNGANTWSGVQSFNSGDFDLLARRWNLGDPSRDRQTERSGNRLCAAMEPARSARVERRPPGRNYGAIPQSSRRIRAG